MGIPRAPRPSTRSEVHRKPAMAKSLDPATLAQCLTRPEASPSFAKQPGRLDAPSLDIHSDGSLSCASPGTEIRTSAFAVRERNDPNSLCLINSTSTRYAGTALGKKTKYIGGMAT